MRMRYLMMPLEQHSDSGLGATGEAFEGAADALVANADAMRASHVHLPINFLYRHAIELYLKSMIVVLHHGLGVAYGTNAHDGPGFVPVQGKWKPLHRVHSVATLWQRVGELFRAHASVLKARCRTDWQATPEGLDASIASIEKADASSTFFRYPDSRSPEAEGGKSSWKPKRPEDILGQMQSHGRPVMALLVVQPDGETIGEAFQFDDAPLAELSRVLADTAKILSGAHTGLRVELVGGR
jgi:hypothetical protein